jgi:hypothetical protein
MEWAAIRHRKRNAGWHSHGKRLSYSFEAIGLAVLGGWRMIRPVRLAGSPRAEAAWHLISMLAVTKSVGSTLNEPT